MLVVNQFHIEWKDHFTRHTVDTLRPVKFYSIAFLLHFDIDHIMLDVNHQPKVLL
jgi:hypothetical protein